MFRCNAALLIGHRKVLIFRIEPLPVWEDEWANPGAYRNPHLLHNIERDGVLVR